jgi:lysophosphatidic acid phosphatase type 6
MSYSMRAAGAAAAGAAAAGAAAAVAWGAATSSAAHAEAAAATPTAKPPHPALAAAAPLPPASSDTLRLVQVVFRHGARTPLSSRTYLFDHADWSGCCSPEDDRAVPADRVSLDLQVRPPPPPTTTTGNDGSSAASTTNNADAKQRATLLRGGCHKGELTLLGKQQALELGGWLRQRYAHGGPGSFLPPSYSQGLVAARTTNYSRTRATLRGVLAGLWPDLAQPNAPAVSALTASDLDEILFADTRACPHLKALLVASADLLESKKEREREAIERAQQALTRALSLPEDHWKSRWSVTDVHDVATSLPAHGRPLTAAAGAAADATAAPAAALARLPPWLEDDVNRMATAEFSHFVAPSLRDGHGETVLRLSMGRLLDNLLVHMDEAVVKAAGGGGGSKGGGGGDSSSSSNGSVTPLRLYSGHDSTVLPLLVAIAGRDVVRWPPYCSHVVLELHEERQTAEEAGAGGKGGEGTGGDKGTAAPRFTVRVLFNGEHLKVGDEGDDAVPLETFRREVLAPFLLSDEDHRLACTRPLTHDSSLPQPEQADADKKA